MKKNTKSDHIPSHKQSSKVLQKYID